MEHIEKVIPIVDNNFFNSDFYNVYIVGGDFVQNMNFSVNLIVLSFVHFASYMDFIFGVDFIFIYSVIYIHIDFDEDTNEDSYMVLTYPNDFLKNILERILKDVFYFYEDVLNVIDKNLEHYRFDIKVLKEGFNIIFIILIS